MGLDAPALVAATESAFTCAPIGMAMVDLAGALIRVNDALCRITGYTPEQACARPFRALSDPRDADTDASLLDELLRGVTRTYQIEKRFLHASGAPVRVLLSMSVVRDAGGAPVSLVAQVQDISARKILEGRLEHLVDHDFLTGLFNARRFDQALTQAIQSSARYGTGGALLLLDLDHFKSVNDQFGHNSGDELLKTASGELQRRIRETDTLARLGGDEFGIILPQVDARQAEVVADGIVKALRRHTATLGDRQIPITTSVGVVLFGDLTALETKVAADLALYEAKDAGRDRFAMYRPSAVSSSRHSSRLAEAERIQCAIAQDRLELHCQPIVDLATNDVSQYELLVRLRTEQGELLPPAAFLYVAERFGTIRDIDAWVVRQAVAHIAAHADAGRTLVLNVNVSASSMGDPLFVATVDRAVAETPIDPARLVFELTEAAAIGNIEHTKTFTAELRSRGFRFALDNFGSGFGSFSYLKHLPFDYVKIDGDFVRGCSENVIDQLVVEAIVAIARGMGKQTVAECVTDEGVMDRLRRSGVDCAQGFHVGAPVPIREALALPRSGALVPQVLPVATT